LKKDVDRSWLVLDRVSLGVGVLVALAVEARLGQYTLQKAPDLLSIVETAFLQISHPSISTRKPPWMVDCGTHAVSIITRLVPQLLAGSQSPRKQLGKRTAFLRDMMQITSLSCRPGEDDAELHACLRTIFEVFNYSDKSALIDTVLPLCAVGLADPKPVVLRDTCEILKFVIQTPELVLKLVTYGRGLPECLLALAACTTCEPYLQHLATALACLTSKAVMSATGSVFEVLAAEQKDAIRKLAAQDAGVSRRVKQLNAMFQSAVEPSGRRAVPRKCSCADCHNMEVNAREFNICSGMCLLPSRPLHSVQLLLEKM
jgi:hypothetical protein